MRNFWDERYSQAEYIYGKEPNLFLKEMLNTVEPGTLLLPGEGEGRNAVYAAGMGWQVDAFDSSMEAQKKAQKLAYDKNVKINYTLSDLKTFNYHANHYDAIGLIYIHMAPQLRKEMHHKIIESLKPGGILILEAFSKEQLEYSSGGPKDKEMLFDIEDIKDDFSKLSIEILKKEVVELNEGMGHSGLGSVIRFVGRKI
jgi:2-polyprenyl-3-methyl-5-hydroxy-6-metoxy-1,4-benzoquinol methylase